MTPEQLQQIFPNLSAAKAQAILPAIVETCRFWDISTKLRVAAFLAQCGMESGAFQYFTEFASGDAYEGQAGLGNNQPGDGRRFKGRGAIQLTGRNNYRRAGQALGQDFENNPELVAKMPWAMHVSGWFWRKGSARGDLNVLSDNGPNLIALGSRDTERWNRARARAASEGKSTSAFDRSPRGFDMVTLGVNGGFNGKLERDAIYDRALSVLPENPFSDSPAFTMSVASTGRTSDTGTEARDLTVWAAVLAGSSAFLLFKVLKRLKKQRST